MNGFIIDKGSLVLNPLGLDASKYAVPEAITQAPAVNEEDIKEPVFFGDGKFGDPEAFARLQELKSVQVKEDASEVAESAPAFSAPECLPC